MPYGTISEQSRAYIEYRARQSGIDLEKLGLEPEMPDLESEADEVPIPDNLYEISVIYAGALDESFYVQSDYEVNIADWLAELCRNDVANETQSSSSSWEVIVTEYAHEDAGAVRYRVSDES